MVLVIFQQALIGSLESTGFATIDCFHFDEYWAIHGKRGDEALIQMCLQHRPDIIVQTYTPVPPVERYNPTNETLIFLRNNLGIPIHDIWFDSIADRVQVFMRNIAPYVDKHVAVDTASTLQKFEKEGTFRPGQLSLWCPQDPRLFCDPGLERDIDIAFMGSLKGYPDRQEAILALLSAGFNIHCAGGQREGRVSPSEYVNIMQRAKIVVSFSKTGGGYKVSQSKGRIFEVTHCGALLLNDENPETERFFKPGIEYVTFDDVFDLIDKARQLLRDDETRIRIAKAGHDRAIHEYNAKNFWRLTLSPPEHSINSVETITKTKNILYIPLEYPDWKHAKSWSYSMSWGIEESILAEGSNCFTIPAMHGISPEDPSAWLSHIDHLCRGKVFDQIWFTANPCSLTIRILNRLKGLAPIRVGIFHECLSMSNMEQKGFSLQGNEPVADFRNLFDTITHAIVTAKSDVDYLALQSIPAFWLPPCVPSSAVRSCRASAFQNTAAFFGTIQGKEAYFLEHPKLKPILKFHENTLEYQTDLPNLYDKLQSSMQFALKNQKQPTETSLKDYLAMHRQLRKFGFDLWLDTLGTLPALVELPQYGFRNSSHIIEAMAAYCPVISYIPTAEFSASDHFTEGKEILLYEIDNPEVLARHIHNLIRLPQWGELLARKAQRKLLSHFTMEKHIERIMDWISTNKG